MRPNSAPVFILSLLFGGTAQASLLTNGGFELPPVNSSPYFINLDGTPGNTLPGWTITNNTVDVVNATGATSGQGTAYEGFQLLDLVGLGSSGGIQQTLATTPGQTYSLSFAYTANPFSTFNPAVPATAQLTVQGNSTLVSQVISSSNAGNQTLNWSTFGTTFTADSTSTTLGFLELFGLNNGGIFLDAVTVDPVPLPGAIWLFLGAMPWLAAKRRTHTVVRS